MSGLKRIDGPAERLAGLLLHDDTMLAAIRTKGYAMQARNAYTAVPGKTSSIAVPLFKGKQICGSLALIFFAAAMPMARAELMFADDLRATADAIGVDLH